METLLKLEELQIGDVVLYPPEEGDWLAQAIALLTNGSVNHAAIYYGMKDGQHCVVESVLKGVGVNPLPNCITEKYAHPILRHTSATDMNTVIECAKRYVDEVNAYPYVNLGMLALLLIAKKFNKETLKSRILYDFALLVCVKLMKAIQDMHIKGDHKMSCSQFTAQCFTDAGEDYDLKFDKLIVQLDRLLKNSKESDAISLLDSVSEDTPDMMFSAGDGGDQEEYILRSEEVITQKFTQLLVPQKDQPLLFEQNVLTTKPLALIVGKIIFYLYEMITGSKTNDLQMAIDSIKFSTNRNFLVTPEDININCSNLKRVGVLAY